MHLPTTAKLNVVSLSFRYYSCGRVKLLDYPKWPLQRLIVRPQSTSNVETSSVEEGNSGVRSDLKKRLFNTVLWERERKSAAVKWRSFLKRRRDKINEGISHSQPITLKLLDDTFSSNITEKSPKEENEKCEKKPTNFPFELKGNPRLNNVNTDDAKSLKTDEFRQRLSREYVKRQQRRMKMWMSDYELYNEDGQEDSDMSSSVNYGTCNPNEPISNVPCGGCGALLHCQDHSIPGYLPAELFSRREPKELRSMICQRCHFLKEFNVALDIRVTPEEYPRIISCIKNKRAIAVLIIDLLDFPCSIWPGIWDIIGSRRPVIVVGNKVDLIPGDHEGYLEHLTDRLKQHVLKMGIAEANIKHVVLVSAYTGFGVEDLITKMHELWEYKSDVFLIGCTNVGKSTLFNMLLQSDFCKTQAVDLVKRATTSLWPGTTLNLLKFPILRPEGWRLNLRRKRLQSVARSRQQEKQLCVEQLRSNRMYHMPSLMQYVGRTFIKFEEGDLFPTKTAEKETGIDDQIPEFSKGRWCYDTPGVMHPDQILNLLTTEELVKVLPRTPIVPRYFVLKPGKSLFLAGLGRIDHLNSSSDKSMRVAVFSSSHLPVSIVNTEDAEDIYKELLGSEFMAVPSGDPERLSKWPGLQALDEIITVVGTGWKECCGDIVLSSAGWVALSGGEDMKMSFRVWTPCALGIHVRQPALLPYSFNFKGKRIDRTPTYEKGGADGSINASME